MNGWIKLHRKFLEWEWFNDTPTRDLFLYCLLRANREEKNYKGIVIPKGGFVTGREELAKALGFSVQQIRTSIFHLKSTNELTIKSTNKGTLIIVNKWEEYQGSDEESTNKQPTTQPSTNQQLTTNKNIRIKEEEKYKGIEDEKLLNALEEFEKMRNKIKKPLTDKARELLLNNLDKIAVTNREKIEILNQSVLNSWQGVYPLKNSVPHETKQVELKEEYRMDF